MKILRPRFLIVVFWSVMTGWLIRYEAFPQWFTHMSGGYRALFEGRPFVLDSWMQITFNDVEIGYTHTWIDSDIESQIESYTIRNKTFLNLNLLGESQPISILVGITLDERYLMQTFSMTLHSRSYRTNIEGRRIGDGRFEVSMATPVGVRTTTIAVPDDVMIYSPVTEMAVRRLKPGNSLRMRVLDPISMTVSEITAEALRRETLQHEARHVETTVLKISYMGLETLSWIDAEGRVLRHETPFGWTMTARSSDKIVTAGSSPLEAGDMLSAMAVPCRGDLVNPRSSRSLTIRITGIPADPEQISSHRQVVEQGDGFLQMTVFAQPMPTRIAALEDPVPRAYRPYLAASPSIQSDHPDMRRRALALTEGSSDSFEAAKAISSWIQNHVRMMPTVSLPSALDVLEQMVGDCNEITYLFVGLARSVGLPARVHVGLVYAVVDGHGAFYYHAWPSVYVGEWVEMDPTWGQTTVDATHISLVTGELGDQIKLLGFMGRARVEILSEEGAQ